MADGKGVTLRQTLEQVAKQTGNKPEELNVPDIPQSLFYIYETFIALSTVRPVGVTIGPIDFAQIKAYSELNNVIFAWWEIEAIRKLDEAWFRVRVEQ